MGAISDIASPMKREIDLAVLTHPHADHLTGFTLLSDYFSFSKVVQMPVSHTSDTYIDWLGFLEENGIPVNAVFHGDEIKIEDNLSLLVLWPKSEEALDELSLNNTSIVLMLEYKDFRALLMGDAEKEVEDELLLLSDSLDANILKVGHHGSGTSSSEDFISAVLPQVAIISVGEDNKFGHPSDEVIRRLDSRGVLTYRTDYFGTIEIISDGKSFWISE